MGLKSPTPYLHLDLNLLSEIAFVSKSSYTEVPKEKRRGRMVFGGGFDDDDDDDAHGGSTRKKNKRGFYPVISQENIYLKLDGGRRI